MNETPPEIAKLFRATEAAHDKDSQPFRYRFSKAGEPCLRSLVYDAIDGRDGVETGEEKKLKLILHAACGQAVHVALQRGAVLLGDSVEVPCQFNTGAVVIKGSADWLRLHAASDFKIVSTNVWRKVQSKPRPKDVLQVNGYAVSKDKTLWQIVYINGKTIFDSDYPEPEVLVHSGYADIELAKDLCHVWEEVDSHVKLGTLPMRVFDAAPTKWPCMFCRHQTKCLEQGRA